MFGALSDFLLGLFSSRLEICFHTFEPDFDRAAPMIAASLFRRRGASRQFVLMGLVGSWRDLLCPRRLPLARR